MDSGTQRQISDIMDRMMESVDRNVMQHLVGTLDEIIDRILNDAGGFEDRTGNTRNSFAVGAYYKGRLVAVSTSEKRLGKPATRGMLKKGEKYNLKTYWSGKDVGDKPFTGIFGNTGGEASSAAVRFLMSHKPRKSEGFSYIVVAGTDYAKFIEVYKKGNLLTATRDFLASQGADVSEVRGK